MTAGDFWWVPLAAIVVACWANGDHASHCPPDRPIVYLVAGMVALLGPFVIPLIDWLLS